MEIKRWDDARAFSDRAEAFLVAHEAHHNLMLGIVAVLVEDPTRWGTAPYLATVETAGRVVGAAAMTPPHNLILSRQAAPGTLDLIAADLRQTHPDLPGVQAPDGLAEAFATVWRRTRGTVSHRDLALRIFQLDTVAPVVGVPGAMRRATEADRDVLLDWTNAFIAEAFPAVHAGDAEQMVNSRLRSRTGGMVLWEDGGPRSLAGYGGPTPTGIRIGPVYTPPEHRGRGYASACVAALSQRLLDDGRRRCFLFTDLANPTSNTVYQRLGYRPVTDVDQWAFE